MEKGKNSSIFGTFCAVIGVLALLATGAYFAMKFLKKKNCCCGEGEEEIEDCDDTVCIIDDDTEEENA